VGQTIAFGGLSCLVAHALLRAASPLMATHNRLSPQGFNS
jgi:hypothetical protein